MESSRRRPFKICNPQRTKCKGIVVENLEELKEKGCERLGLVATSCRAFIEDDGTEIEDEEYFSFIEEQTKLMLVEDSESWTAPEEVLPHIGSRSSSFNPSLESNESIEIDHTDASVPIQEFLVQQIRKNPMFFVSFSDEQLHAVINCDLNYLTMALGKPEKECQYHQETCQRELDKRTEMHEASELLKLYDKAVHVDGPNGPNSKKDENSLR